jgi:hypothetical protein
MNLLKIFILELQAEIIVSPAGYAVKKKRKKLGGTAKDFLPQ